MILGDPGEGAEFTGDRRWTDRIAAILRMSEHGITYSECHPDDSHAIQDLLRPATDDLGADGKTVHGVRIAKFVESAGDVVCVSVFRFGREIAGKRVDGFVHERGWHTTG